MQKRGIELNPLSEGWVERVPQVPNPLGTHYDKVIDEPQLITVNSL
jgi:hypothetical protein